MDWEKITKAGLDVLPKGKAGKLGLAVGAAGAGLKVWNLANTLGAEWEGSHAYHVVVREGPLFFAAERWLTSVLPNEKMKNMIVSPNPYSIDPGSLIKTNDSRQTARVVIAGHRVKVVSGRDSKEVENDRFTPRELKFSMASADARNAVLAHLERLVADDTNGVNRTPEMHSVHPSYGTWTKVGNLPPRTLESVVLPAGARQRLIGRIDRFLAAERRWERMGIPWHYGVLLDGPPGTGKTSTAIALANHYRLDVYILQLSSIKSDDYLSDLTSDLKPRSMLVIEDIDVAKSSRERDGDDDKGPTLAGVLNLLDGMRTPHGMISLMTTNQKSALDPALIRPGRVDASETLGYMTLQQAEAICGLFAEKAVKLGVPKMRADCVPAEITGALREMEVWDDYESSRVIREIIK